MMPATTGDTANGRSISVISRFFPGNRYLEINHAAETPNTMLSGTAIAAVSSVRRIADSVSGSPSFAKYGPTPFANASRKTERIGSATNSPRNARVNPMSRNRTGLDSVIVTGPARCVPALERLAMAAAATPRLQDIDQHEHQ